MFVFRGYISPSTSPLMDKTSCARQSTKSNRGTSITYLIRYVDFNLQRIIQKRTDTCERFRTKFQALPGCNLRNSSSSSNPLILSGTRYDDSRVDSAVSLFAWRFLLTMSNVDLPSLPRIFKCHIQEINRISLWSISNEFMDIV